MKERTKSLMTGFALLLVPLLIATIMQWYVLLVAYYLFLFGIFIYAEMGWKGVIFHILFIIVMLLLASYGGRDSKKSSTEYYQNQTDPRN